MKGIIMIQLNEITHLLKNIILTCNGDKVVQFEYAHNTKTPDLTVYLVMHKIDPSITGQTSFSKNTRDFLYTTGLKHFVDLKVISDESEFTLNFKNDYKNNEGLNYLYVYMKMFNLLYLLEEI